MDFLTLFVLYLLFCFTALLVLCFQPQRLTRCIEIAKNILQTVLPVPVQTIIYDMYNMLFLERNAIFQVFYIILVIAGHTVLLTDVLPWSYDFHPDENHVKIPMCLLLGSTVLFVICSWMDPGEINLKNHEKCFKLYKYDGTYYKKGQKCASCLFIKPARSKHCSFCDICISKFDHHCVWINRCIGLYNQKYFLAFLLMVCVMCIDGAVISGRVLKDIVVYKQLWNAMYQDASGNTRRMTLKVLSQHLFMQYPRLVFLLASLTAVTLGLGGFTGYHIYLAVTNQTTNERYKQYNMSQHGKTLSNRNPYSQGVLKNIIAVLKS